MAGLRSVRRRRTRPQDPDAIVDVRDDASAPAGDVTPAVASARAPAESDDAETARLRQMSRVAGALYVSAGLLVGLSLLVAADSHRNPTAVGAIGVVGLAGGLGWLLAGERWVLPEWLHIPSAAAGAVLVGLLVLASGPAFGGVYGVLVIYVAAFSFYYLPRQVAAALVVFAGAVFGATLWLVRPPAWGAYWTVVMGATVVGAGLIAALGHRTQQLLEREQTQAARLVELDELRHAFLRMVAHDLRSPLSTMVGIAETIADHLEELDPDDVRDLSRRQARQGQRLARIVDDLLDTERLRSRALQPERERLRLDELIERSVELTETGGNPVRVELEPIELSVDPTFIERAVDNLLANAVRHTPEGTPIEVRLGRGEDGVVLAVDDRGPGVPDEHKQDVFQLFHRGSDHSAATGIGLALVSELIGAHGGRCWVEDRPGGGASFRIWLPPTPEGTSPDESHSSG